MILGILSRLWLVISLAWVIFLVYAFNDSGEIHHMTLETWSMLLAPFLVRQVVLFIVYGLPQRHATTGPYKREPSGFTGSSRPSPR